MITRLLTASINKKLGAGKAIIVMGPRQVGKTTMLKEIAEKKRPYLFLNGDDPSVQQQLEGANTQTLKQLIGKYTLVFIDEAQRIKNIGITLKLITDVLKNVQLLVSGSSALELASEINEPLTGRKWEYQMYPVSWEELVDYLGYSDAHQQLEQRLVYGMYPEVITRQGEEREVLQQLASSFLYKDLLSLGGIRKPDLLEKLLRALALQLGNEVSYNELATMLQVDKNTIISYIQLLEKAYVIFRLEPFSRNHRNEITTNRKIYFFDNGIRNALVANFNPMGLRQDTGALWENFLISERMKRLHYHYETANTYFWRTHAQQEIDYIEDRNGYVFAYEFKWGKNAKAKFPKTFSVYYPKAIMQLVTPQNFEEFLVVPPADEITFADDYSISRISRLLDTAEWNNYKNPTEVVLYEIPTGRLLYKAKNLEQLKTFLVEQANDAAEANFPSNDDDRDTYNKFYKGGDKLVSIVLKEKKYAQKLAKMKWK
jgi:uncharacterized protein